jgi:hypothetical protein
MKNCIYFSLLLSVLVTPSYAHNLSSLGGDDFQLPRATWQSIGYFETLTHYYGVNSRHMDCNHHYCPRDKDFFEHFVSDQYAFFLRADDESHLEELCGPNLLTEETRTGEELVIGCTESAKVTYILPQTIKRLAVFPQALFIIRARLYGWCLKYEETLPIESCFTDGKVLVDRAIAEMDSLRSFFDRKYPTLGSRSSYRSCVNSDNDETIAAIRMQNAFRALGIE